MSTFDELVRGMSFDPDNTDELTLTEADESAVFMMTLMETAGADEALDFVQENATDLQAYGLLHDAEVATEATRTIVRMSKNDNFNKVKGITAIRLARQAGDPLYKKYKKYRDLFLEFRGKIMEKYDAKATQEARKSIQNSKRKAARMNNKNGSDLTKRMDKQMKKFDDKKSTAIAK